MSEFLRSKRTVGDRGFYSARDIAKATQQDYTVVMRSMNKLYAYGYLEIERPCMFNRRFRLKERYSDIRIDVESMKLQDI